MKMGENWHVNAPWAQLVVSTKVPDELFKTTLKLTDKIYKLPLQGSLLQEPDRKKT